MKVAQLESVVRRLGLGPETVQFGGLPSEAYVIEAHDGGWRVFYSERGQRSDETWHAVEEDAVDNLWERLASNSWIRLENRP